MKAIPIQGCPYCKGKNAGKWIAVKPSVGQYHCEKCGSFVKQVLKPKKR